MLTKFSSPANQVDEDGNPREKRFLYTRGSMPAAQWAQTALMFRQANRPLPEAPSFSEAWEFSQQLTKAQLRGDFSRDEMRQQYIDFLDDFKWQAHDQLPDIRAFLSVRDPNDRRAAEAFLARVSSSPSASSEASSSPRPAPLSPATLSILEALSMAHALSVSATTPSSRVQSAEQDGEKIASSQELDEKESKKN